MLSVVISRKSQLVFNSVLEYPSREDAEHAVKLLDGKDLRGQPVRVSINEDVSLFICSMV